MSNKSGVRLIVPFVVRCRDEDIALWEIYFTSLPKTMIPPGEIANSEILKGSPKTTLKKFLEMGFNKNYYDQSLIKFFIAWGFKRNYWDDTDLFVEDARHLLFPGYGNKLLKENE